MLSIFTKGSFDKTESFLKAMTKINILELMKKYGDEGVKALSLATPIKSGLTAESWGYETGKRGKIYFINWTNNDVENGFPVAIMLELGYGTGTGGYVQGHDYINPSIKPIFDMIETELWKAVISA